MAPWTDEEDQGAFYRQIAQYDERYLEEIEACLAKVDVPVRIVWGKDDTWIPAEVAHRLCDLIPQASVVLVNGAGHLVHYDAPVALASELRAWLQSAEHV